MNNQNTLTQLNQIILALNTIEVKGENNLASLVGSIKLIKEIYMTIQNDINKQNQENSEVGGD